MATGSDVELIDRPDGNQFVARIWRTTQKDGTTTQKANEELISTTQKEDLTTQKSKLATQKPLNVHIGNGYSVIWLHYLGKSLIYISVYNATSAKSKNRHNHVYLPIFRFTI